MSQTQLDKLEATISRGKWRYIIVQGAIGWGISTAVLFSLFQSITDGAPFIEAIGLSLIIYPIGGIAWGGFMWSYLNKQYSKLQSDKY